jgi:hypothetical protein
MGTQQRLSTLRGHMERFKDFSHYELKLLADAVWMRQRCFIAGDRRFKEYGVLLDEIRQRIDYVPGVFA